jgi:N-acetylneuraminic acid mutarotase
MTQQALGTGMIVPRKRALFGLLDSDGWGWASLKAFVWLVIIILLLGYIPDRAYYFTVNRTLELGINAWSPVNLCSSENEALPCPAPRGAVVAWHQSPTKLDLPGPRTDGTAIQLGSKILYIGGSDGQTAQSTVSVAQVVGVGNFDTWTEGPALPEPRSDASVVAVSGTIYVIGGYDADGNPTTTVFSMTPDPQTGQLAKWKPVESLALKEGRAGAAGVVAPDGLLLIGGEGADGPVTTTLKSLLDAKGVLGKWEAEAPLQRPQADALAAVVGDFVWLYGGHDENGPVGAVQRGRIGPEAAEGYPANPDEGKVVGWDISDAANLPGARDNPAGWSANAALYLVGGEDNDGLRTELYWTIPTNGGDIPEWKHLAASDLPTGFKGGSAFVTGPSVVIAGGESKDGVAASSLRANTAPQAPFFQLGLVGATVPGLKIDGEIGQQLGYMNAALAGTVDFILLLVFGWAWAHKPQARALVARLVRRGRRA